MALLHPSPGLQSSVRIDATAGGSTKSSWIDLRSDPNAPPLLQSVTVSPTSVAGGSSATGTVFLSQPAPGQGITVTLATSSSVARPPGNWSDASNAASYELQIDNNSNFSAPLVLNITTTASQASVDGLSPVSH